MALPDSAVADEYRPGLYERIRYDPELEARAIECLADHDVGGCRSALGKLLSNVDRSAAAEAPRQVVQLLVDILQRVNGRVHQGPAQDAMYQAERVALIEQFSSCNTFEAARERFLPALNRLLGPLRQEGRARHPLVQRARRFIEQNHQRRISLSSVASILHVSPNYLSRLFRRETGLTLTAYVHRVRLDHAIALLTESNRSISEIAYCVGYQNYRDFYRNFVKYEKASPREVRRRLRDAAAEVRAGSA